MTDRELKEAHDHSFKNKEEIMASKGIVCYFCKMEAIPDDIDEWVKEQDGKETAVCPSCGIDSIIGDASGLNVTPAFLEEMGRHWGP